MSVGIRNPVYNIVYYWRRNPVDRSKQYTEGRKRQGGEGERVGWETPTISKYLECKKIMFLLWCLIGHEFRDNTDRFSQTLQF